jgi:hypothetical protein
LVLAALMLHGLGLSAPVPSATRSLHQSARYVVSLSYVCDSNLIPHAAGGNPFQNVQVPATAAPFTRSSPASSTIFLAGGRGLTMDDSFALTTYLKFRDDRDNLGPCDDPWWAALPLIWPVPWQRRGRVLVWGLNLNSWLS